MSTAIIINPIAGGANHEAGRARAELASAIIDRHGDPAEVFVTESPGHAREIAQAAVERGARLVMAWGGDGTINEVVRALAFNEVPLGIVPAGSGNGLARELGVDLNPERAISNALAAEPRAMDLGELDGHLFANIAGIGLDAQVAWEFAQPSNRQRGFGTYVRITMQRLITYQPLHYTIAISTPKPERVEARAVLVTIANSAQFGNNARIAPGARVDDGLLDLVVMEERSRWETVINLPRLFNGTVAQAPGCSIRQVDRAVIESERPMLFHVDGEPFEGGTSLRVRVHPGALMVAVK